MSFQVKRIVLFFCGFYLGLVGCLGNTAIANKIFLGGVFKEYARLRVVSGVATCNGYGLGGVEIYDGNKWLGDTDSEGFYSVQITQGLPTTLTPVKTGYQFDPPSIVIPSDQYDHPYRNFTANGACPPMKPTLISPLGTIYSSTPTFKWVGAMNAKYFNLLVVGSSKNTQYGYTEIEAGCSSGSANCSVTPPTQLADGSYSWSVTACLNAGSSSCGEESSFMSFIVSAGDVTMSLDSKLDWQGTGFVVGQNMEIAIKATGTVTWMANNTSGPDGVVHLFNRVDDRFLHEAILGKVGNGPVFLVGSSYRGKPGAGELKLITNDIRRVDNSGSFSVTITPWPLQE